MFFTVGGITGVELYDGGWSETAVPGGRRWHKGYAIGRDLDAELDAVVAELRSGRDVRGNFIIIDEVGSHASIWHPHRRPVTLWRDPEEGTVSSLWTTGERIGAHQLVSINLDTSKIQPRVYTTPTVIAPRTVDQALDEISAIIDEQVSWLNYQRLPVRFYYSGGLDTLMLYAYLLKHGVDFEIVYGEHIDDTLFWQQHRDYLLKTFWGFEQIHSWPNQSLFVSGCNGDENFLRGPLTAEMWCKSHINKSVLDLVKPEHYHHWYFSKPKTRATLAEVTTQYHEPIDQHIVDRCYNDTQHWSVDTTTIFTPLADERILPLVLSIADREAVVSQIVDGALQKALIARIDSGLLDFLSVQKNINEHGPRRDALYKYDAQRRAR